MVKNNWLVRFRHLMLVSFVLAGGSLMGQAGGENQATATLIPALPFVGQGNNAAAVDDYFENCPDVSNSGSGRDHVYRYNNGASTLTVNVSLCVAFTDYDSQLYIYEDTCITNTAVACMEDGCQSPAYNQAYNSRIVSFTLAANKTYYFVVDGYDGTGGNYQINIDTVAPPAPVMIPFSNGNSGLTTTNFHSGVPMGIADMNGDWLDDIVRLENRRDLYINYQQSLGGFAETNHGQIGSGSHWSMCIADVDENGYNDIMAGGAYNDLHLYRANGTGTAFTSGTLPSPNIFLQGSNFADINNDGHIDIFACHDDAESNKYKGDGTGTFVYSPGLINTTTSPSSDNSGNYGSIWTDYDHDGDLDMYLSKCRQGVSNMGDPRRINMLFQNDGRGNYTEVSYQAGLKDSSQSWLSDFGDIDNDGDMDVIIINHDLDSKLMRNNGDGTFTNVTAAAGLAGAIDFTGIQAFFRDFNNDGWLDLLVTGSSHKMFVNNGNMTFTEDDNGFVYGTKFMESCAIGDVNHDGFLDVYGGYASIYNSPTNTDDRIWINDGASGLNYFVVNPVGTVSNINGIGAWVEIYGPWGVMVREVRSGEGYGVMNSFSQHFGIGSATGIDSCYVFWPSGIVDRVVNPSPNSFLVIVEGQSPAQKVIVRADSTVNIASNAADLWGTVQIQDSATTRISIKYWQSPGGTVDSVFIADYAFNNNIAKFDFSDFPNALLPNTTYKWMVHGIYDVNGMFGNPADCYSDTLTFTTGGPVSLAQQLQEADIQVYPNPFSSSASLDVTGYDFSLQGALQLDVYEVQGRKVMSIDNIRSNRTTIERGNLSNGMYIYRLRTEDGRNVRAGRIVLQ
jgi:hypothetical protein